MVRLTPDTLWYQSNDIVSPISIDNAEIRRPTHRNHRWLGLAAGGVAGGAIGAAAAYYGFERGQPATPCATIFEFEIRCYPSRGNAAIGGAFVGAVIGGGLGYVVGRTLGRWETVEFDQITVGTGNLGVSLRIRR